MIGLFFDEWSTSDAVDLITLYSVILSLIRRYKECILRWYFFPFFRCRLISLLSSLLFNKLINSFSSVSHVRPFRNDRMLDAFFHSMTKQEIMNFRCENIKFQLHSFCSTIELTMTFVQHLQYFLNSLHTHTQRVCVQFLQNWCLFWLSFSNSMKYV